MRIRYEGIEDVTIAGDQPDEDGLPAYVDLRFDACTIRLDAEVADKLQRLLAHIRPLAPTNVIGAPRTATVDPEDRIDAINRRLERIVEELGEARREEVRAIREQRDAATAERDAILRWSIERAGYIGTTTAGSFKWWALGMDGRRVYANTPEKVVRLAAGIDREDESS